MPHRRPSTLKILRFTLGELCFAASAHHFYRMLPREQHAINYEVIELGEELGLFCERSRHTALVKQPGTGRELCLGLGEISGLDACQADDILVFPPWLRGDWSRVMLPACLCEQGQLTWLLDIERLVSER